MKKIIFAVLPLVMLAYANATPSNSVESRTVLPKEVMEAVGKTFSVNAAERAEGAFKLGKIGKEAHRVVPFLMRMLGDDMPAWCRYNRYGEWTTPGREAAKAIAEIGPPAIEYIISLLEDKHPYVSMAPHMEKNLAFALAQLTGLELQTSPDSFKKWSEALQSR